MNKKNLKHQSLLKASSEPQKDPDQPLTVLVEDEDRIYYEFHLFNFTKVTEVQKNRSFKINVSFGVMNNVCSYQLQYLYL